VCRAQRFTKPVVDLASQRPICFPSLGDKLASKLLIEAQKERPSNWAAAVILFGHGLDISSIYFSSKR
jgi:hypothetical protein